MQMTPQQAVDFIFSKAPGILKQDKAFVPMLFIFGEKRYVIVLFKFEDAEYKRAVMRITGWDFAHLKPYCIGFVSEAWMSNIVPPEGKGVSEMPDRKEVLQIVAQGRDGEAVAEAVPFSRTKGEIVLGEPIRSSEVRAYLLDLFWEGVSQRDRQG